MSDESNNDDERKSLVNKEASLSAIYNESEDKILLGRKISRVLRKLIPGYSANGEIDEAWSYFEHITLPRQQLASDGSGKRGKAPPGAKGTFLYPGWTTPQDDLRDFGTGVAIYFETMRALIVICLIAGCIYFPNFLYYRSDKYAAEGQSDLVGTLRGSLICPDTKWVPCPTCMEEDWADDLGRFAKTVPNNLGSNETLTFVLSNECAEFRLREGILHLVVMAFLTVAIFSLGFFQTRRELEYDEELLTASDFSIKVDNPPSDAVDPDEWREFFSQIDGGEVVYCTVALDNEDLIKALAKRRVLLLKLRHKLKASELKDMASIVASSELAQAHPKEYKQLHTLEETCRELLSKEYATTSIFVTFQTEQAQRNVLRKLSVSKIDIADNNISALRHPHCAFRGSLVLDVAEAREPTSIRWEDQDETSMHKFIQRMFTSFLTALLMGLGFIAVRSAFRKDVNLAAYVIALLNIAGSHVFKFVNRLEAHPNEGGYQASLYVKLSIFRWMNTAVVTTLVTPFTKTISEGGLIESVHAVLKAEIITQPIVHMCDIMGTIRRHFLAPFAPHQDSMNMYFRGGVQSLGEKYTNMTKTVFLCFFYSVIFPASFFFGAVALFAVYYTDKFLLLRSWAPIPAVGNDIAKLSRFVFFPLTLVTIAIMSEFYWSAYPFDNLCDTDMFIDQDTFPSYLGVHSAVLASNSSNIFAITVDQGDDNQMFRYCNQNYLERIPDLLNFFAVDAEDWMSEDQLILTFVFGIVAVIVLVIKFAVLFYRSIIPDISGAMYGGYFTKERDSGKHFTDQEHIEACIPQIRHPMFPYPLIASEIDNINLNHIGWVDPTRDYDYYNLTKDVTRLMGDTKHDKPRLTIVKQYTSPQPPIQDDVETTDVGVPLRSGYGSTTTL